MDSKRSGPFIHPAVPLPLVGRKREQKDLDRALDLMRHGYGGVVLVGGETGIGKTTLVQQLRSASLPDAPLVLTGYCYDLADTRPYAPWQRILSSAPDESGLPSVGTALSKPASHTPVGTQHELFEVISDGLTSLATHAPLALILEDIHWADRASLDLLRHISHHAAETRMLVIATYRTDELDASQALTEMIPSLVRESNTHRIVLRRLGLDDILSLVAARYGLAADESQQLAEYLFTRAGGNPFFTVELMRDLEERGKLVRGEHGWQSHDLANTPVPEVVQQVIVSRLGHLHQDTHDLLELAAVIGQDAPVDLWQAVSGASEDMLIDTIQQAESLHLAFETADGRQLRFNHALIRETLYDSKPALQRRQHHRAIAETLIQQSDAAPNHVAHHLALAEDPRAVDWLIRAGEQAEQLHAAHDAVTFVSRAIELARHHRLDVPSHAYRVRARALETIGDFDSANQDLQTVLAVARRANELAAEREALSDLGMLWSGKDYRRAGAYYKDALDVARTMGDQFAVARTLNRIGNWHANTGSLHSAIDLHQQALLILEEQGNEMGLLETHDLLGTTRLLAGDYRNALEHLEITISQARRIGDKPRLASALTMIPMLGGNIDVNFEAGVALSRDSDYWLNCAEEGLQIARCIGWKASESFALTTLGAVISARGDLGRGLSLADQGYAIARSIGHQQWVVFGSLVLGMIWSELEDLKRAEFYLARCRASATTIGSHLWATLAHSVSGLIQLKMGDIARAAEVLSPYLATESSGRFNSQRSFQLALSYWRLAEGDTQAALDCAETLIALEEGSSVIKGAPQVLKIKADALAALNRTADADQAYRDADDVARMLGLESVRWRIKAAHSELLAISDSVEAATVASQAADLVHDISMSIPDVDVRDRFSKLANRKIPKVEKRRTHARRGFGLTERELDVLRLTAQGFTNVDIGSRLFISPRTVAQHLQSIYGKLGVNSRTAAAAFAYEHDLA